MIRLVLDNVRGLATGLGAQTRRDESRAVGKGKNAESYDPRTSRGDQQRDLRFREERGGDAQDRSEIDEQGDPDVVLSAVRR
jgi:hypothetical protein